jgi:outer membrane protein
MKTTLVLIMVLALSSAFGQNIAHIEIDKILESMPEYETAAAAIEEQVKQWETELDNRYQGIEKMYQEYVNNEATMTGEEKKMKQEEIFQEENMAREYREQKFGAEGEIQILQEEKFGPLYEKIFTAAEEVATEEGYDYIFDKSSDNSWVYTNPAKNITEKVKEKLGGD